MPAMPRGNKKAKKISYAIIGPPENRTDIESPRQKKIHKELIVEDGQLAR